MKIKILITDDNNNSYEGEMHLTKNKMIKKSISLSSKDLIKKKTTRDKIIELIDEGYFDTNKTISDIATGLMTHDYHFKSSSLTLPLRGLVREKILKRMKGMPDGTKSRYWTYVKVGAK